MDIPYSDIDFIQLRKFLQQNMGLNFLENQKKELIQKMERAALHFGYPTLLSYTQHLYKQPPTDDHIGQLASHLTVGETYFMREKKGFDFLEQIYLPDVIRTRLNGERRLRIWCAGCSTGEEAYSLAITLSRIIPNIEKWKISILATDINSLFLEKARIAEYTKWSFRNTKSDFKQQFFDFIPPNKYKVIPRIKNLVEIIPFNLATEKFDTLTENKPLFDIIFCRNVLIYFPPEGITSLTNKLHSVLAKGGILVVSPVEVSSLICNKFDTIIYSGLTIYHKGTVKNELKHIPPEKQSKGILPPSFPSNEFPRAVSALKTSDEEIKTNNVTKLPDKPPVKTTGQSKTADETIIQKGTLYTTERTPLDTAEKLKIPEQGTQEELLLMAKKKANLGELKEAESLCETAIANNKLDPAIYYLMATIMQEQGNDTRAIQNLKTALYLDPDFVLAHFLHGSLSIRNGNENIGKKSFKSALSALSKFGPDDIIPESDGITASRLKEIILSILSKEFNSETNYKR